MLIAVCSLKGSPGVTTFSAALAACRWPTGMRAMVVEADPSGGDLAARLELQLSPGLVSLAAATRAHPDPSEATDPGKLWAHAQTLPGGLTVLPAPPGADQAQAALAALLDNDSAWLRRLAADPGIVVIADCGRVDSADARQPVLRAADEVLLLTRAHVDDLVHLTTQLEAITYRVRHLGLLLVGRGCSAAEVTRELDMPVMAAIPQDRRTAAALCGHARVRRGLARSALGQAAADVATTVLGGLRRHHEHASPSNGSGGVDDAWAIRAGHGQTMLAASRDVARRNGRTS